MGLFGSKAKIVERGRVGFRKRKIDHPDRAARISDPTFATESLARIGLDTWQVSSFDSSGAPMFVKAHIASPAGNLWRLMYGIDGNAIAILEHETEPSAVDLEAIAIRDGLLNANGLL